MSQAATQRAPIRQPYPARRGRSAAARLVAALALGWGLWPLSSLGQQWAGAAFAQAALPGSLNDPGQPQAPIFVAYPADGHRVTHPFVLLEGSVRPGADLQLNGRPVSVGPDGLFIEWVPLQPGANALRLTSRLGAQRWAATVRVTRQAAPARPTPPTQPVTPPRTAEVAEPDEGQALNTVRAAWEDDAGRSVLYARAGTQVQVVGVRGDLSRVRLADGRLLWASRSTLRLLPAGTPPPVAAVGAPSVPGAVSPPQVAEPGRWQEVSVPVSVRVPFALSERGGGAGGAGLRLSLFGARPVAGGGVANGDVIGGGVTGGGTDWTQHGGGAGTLPPGWAVQASAEGSTLHLDLQIDRPLHGYQAVYRTGPGGRDELVLRVRTAPRPQPERPLAGRRIVLDAGHGGAERGGAGPLRIPEKGLTLPIALRTAELLRAQGAEVTLTRQDDRTVPLYTRPLLAETQDADVLVSIHANAIPDGKDPRTVRGLGSYFTHEQSRPLAAALQRALVAAAPQVGDDGLHPGANLALTRPTSQPSVLLELGYLTDPQNLRFLMSDAGQQTYAQGIAAGLSAYFAGLPQ